MAGVVVEWVAIDVEGWLLGSEEEYGTCLGVSGRCFGCSSVSEGIKVHVSSCTHTVTTNGVRGIVLYLSRILNGMAGPFLHGCAIDLLLVVLGKV